MDAWTRVHALHARACPCTCLVDEGRRPVGANLRLKEDGDAGAAGPEHGRVGARVAEDADGAVVEAERARLRAGAEGARVREVGRAAAAEELEVGSAREAQTERLATELIEEHLAVVAAPLHLHTARARAAPRRVSAQPPLYREPHAGASPLRVACGGAACTRRLLRARTATRRYSYGETSTAK